jgi:hypothetical protein
MNNSTQATTASIIAQRVVCVGLDNGEIYFNIGNLSAKGTIAKDNLFHHIHLPIKQYWRSEYLSR